MLNPKQNIDITSLKTQERGRNNILVREYREKGYEILPMVMTHPV